MSATSFVWGREWDPRKYTFSSLHSMYLSHSSLVNMGISVSVTSLLSNDIIADWACMINHILYKYVLKLILGVCCLTWGGRGNEILKSRPLLLAYYICMPSRSSLTAWANLCPFEHPHKYEHLSGCDYSGLLTDDIISNRAYVVPQVASGCGLWVWPSDANTKDMVWTLKLLCCQSGRKIQRGGSFSMFPLLVTYNVFIIKSQCRTPNMVIFV